MTFARFAPRATLLRPSAEMAESSPGAARACVTCAGVLIEAISGFVRSLLQLLWKWFYETSQMKEGTNQHMTHT